MGTNYYEKRNLYSDDELVELYLKERSTTKVAAALGISYETVRRALKRKGIARDGTKFNGRNQPGRKITDEALFLEAKTLNSREIAQKYEMSEENVYRRARKLGITVQTSQIGGKWRSRAKRYGCALFDETITLRLLIQRDEGVCKICGGLTDLTDINNGHIGRAYPTLDHIVPLSKGGSHTWDNVQLAHMACNAGKCDRLSGGES